MPIVLNGSGPITGVTSLNTTVSDTEIGFLDGVTSAIQSQINTAGGLVKITDQTFSSVTTVSVNSCFTSTYENYRVIIDIPTKSGSADILFRLRASGSNNGVNNSGWTRIFIGTTDFTVNGGGDNGGVSYWGIGTLNVQDAATTIMDIFRPQVAASTRALAQSVGQRFGAANRAFMQLTAGYDTASTSWDGFTIDMTSSCSGTIRVYGYRN